ncbi:MAG: metallophosphoesterase family protein [Clostridia bacterium]|nr:metallophosphoesterase family protein [Clostridia bacterium]MBR1686334.1 metallophosphoesterase family protein [Clostridia bacterium]MBR2288836.1 metallophosphoesterase family protein [Clostridia bacterium]
MKILLIADQECPALWDHYRPEHVAGIDLIISCGDLKREYLEFLVTMTGKPLLYVPGNHDERYADDPPGGCENIDGNVFTFRGLRIGGLGGCLEYSSGEYQYTEREMVRRVHKFRRVVKKAGGLDIFVSHASLTGYGDAEDRAHRGFDCFQTVLDTFHPQYMCHGHVHQTYGWNIPRMVEYEGIPIINAFERYVLEIPEGQVT